MKVAIYSRVSDDKLKEDGERRQDIKRQIGKIAPMIKTLEQTENFEIFLDDGKSAFKEDYQSRPGFVKLLKAIRGRQIQKVYVESLDRWSRRLEDGLKTMKEASDNGCTVTSIAEGEIDVTSANGWFRCAIGFMMAEWASRIMADKVRSGMARAKAAGKHLGRPKGNGRLNLMSKNIQI